MSNEMFNEVPVVGKTYKFGDWEKYAIHNDAFIKGFFGPYRWLSNFGLCPNKVAFDGQLYPTSENAFQAAKIIPAERFDFIHCSASESKKIWKTKTPLYNAASWDAAKYEVMAGILFDKFLRNSALRQKLVETGDKYLEELNHWQDCWWGVDIKKGGLNNLGKILMKIRTFWKKSTN